MGRLTLRLPDSLHRRLAEEAAREGASLNQYLLYLLAQGAGSPYALHLVPDDEIRDQEHAYGDLLAELGSATHEEISAALAAREDAEPEAGLTPDLLDRIRAQIEGKPTRR